MANLISLSALPRQSTRGYSVVVCQGSEKIRWLGCLDLAVLWTLLCQHCPEQSACGHSVFVCQGSEQIHCLGCLDMAVLWLLLHS